VLVRAPLGGERRRLALDDPAQLVDVVHARLVQAHQEPQRVVERIGKAGNDERTVADGLDQALRLEHAQRLAHGRAACAVELRQLAFGRQGVSGQQPPLADLREHLLGDQLVDLAPLDRLVRALRALSLDAAPPDLSDNQTPGRGYRPGAGFVKNE